MTNAFPRVRMAERRSVMVALEDALYCLQWYPGPESTQEAESAVWRLLDRYPGELPPVPRSLRFTDWGAPVRRLKVSEWDAVLPLLLLLQREVQL